MPTTPNGWPYVTPTDHPVEYPAVSQQIATKLEGALGGGRIQAGSAYGGSPSLRVNFPIAYTVTPTILISPLDNDTTHSVAVTAVDPAGFDIAVAPPDKNISLTWLAIGT